MAKSTSRKKVPRPRKLRAAAIGDLAIDKSCTIVYIHGIGNKPAPTVLKRQWDQALFGIDMGARTRMAYWADIRYPQPLPLGSMDGLTVGTQEAHRPFHFSDKRHIKKDLEIPWHDEKVAAFALAIADRLFTRIQTQMGIKEVEGKILPDWIRGSATEWITKLFIQDVAAYFYNGEQREEIRNRLRKNLIPEGGPYLLIAHSLGSVIAYDVLRLPESGSRIQIPLFITLGSPLGIDEVQDHLEKPLLIPEQVTSWNNFSDVLDPVAFDKGLSDEFSPKDKIEDEIVVNRDSLRFHGFNPHSATGYLNTSSVQGAVRKILDSTFAQPISDFVIARDVAAEMANPTELLPVLIELKDEMSGKTMDEKRNVLVEELRQMTANHRDASIDPLRRYVAAKLTPNEIHNLSVRHPTLEIARIWKNSEKRALLDKSSQVVQAYTANLGYGAAGKGITWAILDTGIKIDHPHFKTYKNIAAQYDCTQIGNPIDNKNGGVGDGSGHGTHVAGIIAGIGKNRHSHLKGMAPEASLYIYKVLGDDGRGNDSWIIKALDHIAQINESSPNLVIHGINLSLGGPFDPTVYGTGHSPICRELRRLWRMGVVVCIAAGNEGRLIVETADGEQEMNLDLSIGDPANLEEAIAVGSVHKEQPHMYGISYFSSRGPTADGRPKPDLVAPGERINSCNARFITNKPESYYVPMSGTSMACPHVSGIIAAFLSVRREFIGYPDKVKEILLAHCTDLKRDRYHQGAGIPNLVRMLAET